MSMNSALADQLQQQLAEQGITAKPLAWSHFACLDIPVEHWADVAKLAKGQSLRLVDEWAAEETDGFAVYVAFAQQEQGYALLRAHLEQAEFPSITPIYVAAARMERVIYDMYGIVPIDHPDLRSWLKHEHWPTDAHPLRKQFDAAQSMPHEEGQYPFIEAEGDGVYEIPVGPVHAGIIEPGHFRFLAVGEQILNLEERLGYVHKGIEKRMEGRDLFGAVRLAGRISGDATVAHAWACALAAENAAGVEAPARAQTLRAVLCERERMANHIGDIGTICNDAAWSFMHMQCQRRREELARLHSELFGHRLLMDRVIPGGVSIDLSEEQVAKLITQTRAITEEMRFLHKIYEEHTPIRERVVDSGCVKQADALELGLLGYAGRSVGVDCDARRDAAYAPYDSHPVQVVVCPGGDVAARLWVRFREIYESARLIEALLSDLPPGPVSIDIPLPVAGAAGAAGFAVVESWRGEIAAWLRFDTEGDADGRVARYHVRDPSMINWLGLELAVRDVPVPDFPLNNKSFNCSYSGHDL
jgi:Ni,Fe-hydrogenase III large subunit/Ni,Fe-hydrogenase III component G